VIGVDRLGCALVARPWPSVTEITLSSLILENQAMMPSFVNLAGRKREVRLGLRRLIGEFCILVDVSLNLSYGVESKGVC